MSTQNGAIAVRSAEQDVLEFLGKSRAKRVSILTHVGPDPDAICSGFAIRHLVLQLSHAEAVLMVPGKISSRNRKFLSALRISASEPRLEESELIITVDVPSLSMLGEAAPLVISSKAPLIQIDHHSCSSSMEKIAAIRLIDESSPSTTEIAYSLLRSAGAEIPRSLAQVLVTGIVAESGCLTRLRNSSLPNLCELSKRGGDVEAALHHLRRHMPLDERIARLRSAQRLVMKRIDGILIAVSHVGSYHTSAASSLLTLGADLVATLAKSKKELKITIRANENFVSRTGIHVGRDLCTPLGKILHGEGSGHKAVGGIRAKCGILYARSTILSFLEEKSTHAIQSSDK